MSWQVSCKYIYKNPNILLPIICCNFYDFTFLIFFCHYLSVAQNREKPTVQFATMKFHKKCVYSQTHFLYTRDESLLPDMPPPHPPYTRKSEIFDARQYRRVDKKALKVHVSWININIAYIPPILLEIIHYTTDTALRLVTTLLIGAFYRPVIYQMLDA